MNNIELSKVREYIIDNIMRNPNIMFNDDCRGCECAYNNQIDLPAVIASLYNMLHREITGEHYEYFFHWANKIGSMVDDNYLTEVMK